MKRFSFALSIPLLSVILLLINPGCATAPSPAILATIQTVSHEAAYVGASIYLTQHPDAKPIFDVAEQSLDALVEGGVFDVAAFEKAIAGLPVDVFHGETGAIINGAIVTVYSIVLGFIDIKDAPTWVAPLVIGTRDGLQQALGASSQARMGAPKRVFKPCVIPKR